MIRTALVLCALLLLTGFLVARDAEVSASVNADRIGIDDLLLFRVTYAGIQNPDPPSLSGLDGFTITQTSQSSEFRYVNGETSSLIHFEFYLKPQRMGTLIISPLEIELAGTVHRTQPFRIEVVQGSLGVQPRGRTPRSLLDEEFSLPGRRDPGPAEVDVFLRSDISSQEVVMGEPLILRILLYARNRVESINPVSGQSIPGFWQEWFPVPKSIQGRSVEVDGKRYEAYEIRKVALFPNKSGQRTIPSMKFELNLADRNFSIFSTPRTVTRESQPVSVQVNPLPSEARNLPVGAFTFSARTESEEIDVNDILTLTLIISGTGNIKTVDVPLWESGEFFSLYPAKMDRSFSFKRDQIIGNIICEVPVAFKRSGMISFPALTFRFYDPRLRRVVVDETEPLDILVTGEKERQTVRTAIPGSEIVRRGEDIEFIQREAINDQTPRFYNSTVYYLLLILPFLGTLLLLFKRRVVNRLDSENRRLRARRALFRTIKALRQVGQYGEIHPLLEKYLEMKSPLRPADMHAQKIDEFLMSRRVSDYDRREFLRIKGESESSRFSPLKKEPEAMQKDLSLLIGILKRMDKRLK